MNKPHLLFPLSVLTIVLLLGCNAAELSNTTLANTNTAWMSLTSKPEDKQVAFIYQYNPTLAKLEYRAVEVVQPSGDQLLDAINSFLQQHPSASQLRIDRLIKRDQSIKCVLIGTPGFANPTDSIIFQEALELTISRNSGTLESQLQWISGL